jgi:hypothetical protein
VVLALVLHGTAPAFQSQSGDERAAAEARATRTGTPSHAPHTIRPRPSQTGTPYPGGAALPGGPAGNAFFRVSDTEAAPGIAGDLGSMIWIVLGILVVGVVIRWFVIAARPNDQT